MVTLSDRFWALVDMTGGCWTWTRPCWRGYGTWPVDGKKKRVHRLVYEALVGPIPEGHVVLQTCGNPACVNPEHLVTMTKRDMHIETGTLTGENATKTHCLRGHPLEGRNVILKPQSLGRPGYARQCRECHNLRARERNKL